MDHEEYRYALRRLKEAHFQKEVEIIEKYVDSILNMANNALISNDIMENHLESTLEYLDRIEDKLDKLGMVYYEED